MKIFIIMGIIAGCFLLPASLFAHPPSNMELSYDLETQTLHIQMRHTTHDRRKDYIRKIEITKNEDEQVTKRYSIQSKAMQFTDDISMTAEAGDHIAVKAFSEEGGSKSMSLTVKKMDDAVDTNMKKGKKQNKKKDKASKGSGY